MKVFCVVKMYLVSKHLEAVTVTEHPKSPNINQRYPQNNQLLFLTFIQVLMDYIWLDMKFYQMKK